ncbi:4Fe-4S binding protein [Blattabacterium cuenoti]|uniref:4Fe-4S binding protein n=1 Tax=Blattabacterium cuenoti TaxID=1653831 RepID=UPI00163BF674|nr:4Fe-4S dicluster domain-containing protein [Blattabacterium cuenoti]
MSIKITEKCINCGACEPECPNNAIYEGGKKWRMSDGTSLKKKNNSFDPTLFNESKKNNIYFIISEKCTECVGFYDKPQCIEICPVNCCIADPHKYETREDLLKKKFFLHSE